MVASGATPPGCAPAGAARRRALIARMKRVLVFDVNETLLDLSALDPHFQRVFGDAAVRVEWSKTRPESPFLRRTTGRDKQSAGPFRAAFATSPSGCGPPLSPETDGRTLRGVCTFP